MIIRTFLQKFLERVPIQPGVNSEEVAWEERQHKFQFVLPGPIWRHISTQHSVVDRASLKKVRDGEPAPPYRLSLLSKQSILPYENRRQTTELA